MASHHLDSSHTDIRQRVIEALETRQRDSILGIQDEVFPIIEQYTGNEETAIDQLAEIICSEFTVEGGLKINAATLWGALLNPRWMKFAESSAAIHAHQPSRLEQPMSLACIKHDRILGHFGLRAGEYTLGRALDNHIHLRDETVSRHHATLTVANQQASLENSNQANGTLVNTARVEQTALHEGDVIRIGQHRLMLVPTHACHEIRLHEIAMPQAVDSDDLDAVFAEMAAEQATKKASAGDLQAVATPTAAYSSPTARTADHTPQAAASARAEEIPPTPEHVEDTTAHDIENQAVLDSDDEILAAERPDVRVINSAPSRPLMSPRNMALGAAALMALTVFGISKLPTSAGNPAMPQTAASSDRSTVPAAPRPTASSAPSPSTPEVTAAAETPTPAPALIEQQATTETTATAPVTAESRPPAEVAAAVSGSSLAEQLVVEQPVVISNPAATAPEAVTETAAASAAIVARPAPTATAAPQTLVSDVYESRSDAVGIGALLGSFSQVDTAATSRRSDANDLNSLLERASRQMAQLKLTTPEDDNALDTYQRILALSPAHPQAVDGLRTIADNYLRLALQSRDKGSLINAMEMVRRGLGVDPTHTELRNLEASLGGQSDSMDAMQRPQEPELSRVATALLQAGDDEDLPLASFVPATSSATTIDDRPTDLPLAEVIEQPAAANKSGPAVSESLEVSLQQFGEPLTAASSPALSEPLKLNMSVEELILQAERQELFRQITAPAGDNAVETYRKILRISPMHPQAMKGLERIAGRYYARAKLFEETNYLAEAISATQKGLDVSPNHAELQQLQEHLKWRLSGK